jgi:hypothetical protein
MDKSLPVQRDASECLHTPRHVRKIWRFLAFSVLVATALRLHSNSDVSSDARAPPDARAIIDRCKTLHLKPGPERDFFYRAESDRFVNGTKPVLLRNATIWTGEKNGTEVFRGNVLMSR